MLSDGSSIVASQLDTPSSSKPSRNELKNRARDQSLTHEERMEARGQLSKLPRRSSLVRLSTRSFVWGRSRAVYRELGLSRITFREMALEGKLPGIKKASW